MRRRARRSCAGRSGCSRRSPCRRGRPPRPPRPQRAAARPAGRGGGAARAEAGRRRARGRALSGGRLAAAGDPARGSGSKATSGWSVYDLDAAAAGARRTRRARSTRPSPSRSNNRCAAAPRPTGRFLADRARDPGAARRAARRGGRAPHRPAAAARSAAIRRSARAATRPVRFSGSWSVRLPGAGHHANHIHPAGWLSSAFYVALPDDGAGPARAGSSSASRRRELGLDLPPIRHDRAQARAAGAVPLDHVARHGAVRRRRAAHRRVRRRGAAL